MKRSAMVLALAFLTLAPLAATAKERLQYDLYLNGVKKGYERFKIETDTKKGTWSLSSEIHYQLPMPKAKRNYVDLQIYPEIDYSLADKKFEGYYYRMSVNDYSKTDLVEAQDSATEMIDQDWRSYDLFNRQQQEQEDEAADRINLGVNAGKVVALGSTLHFQQTLYSNSRMKDEKLPEDLVVLDAYNFSLYTILAQRAEKMTGDSEAMDVAFPQVMRLKKGLLQYMGAENTPVHGGKVMILKHYDVVVDETTLSSFWVDKAGKVVQVVIPGEGLMAVLSKYQPQPFDKVEPRVSRQAVVATGNFTEKSYMIPSGAVQLGATLTLPAGQGPFRTILMVQNIQAVDRDGNETGASGRASSWKQLAYLLAAKGFASLRWDCRGTGESGGAPERASWDERMGDLASLTDWLAKLPTTSGGKVILLSQGLGGWGAAKAAGSPEVSALLALSYPAKPLLRLWKEQVNTIGDPEARLRASQELDNLASEVASGTKEWGSYQGRKVNIADLRALAAVDPTALAAAVKVPCLFAYPEKDSVVLPYHGDLLSPSLHAGQKIVVLPGIGFRLTAVDQEYGASGLVEAKNLEPLFDWLSKEAPGAAAS
jgi:pimeloyl-ACP methyl ester carboxylesterase